jgi:hypothetical protein
LPSKIVISSVIGRFSQWPPLIGCRAKSFSTCITQDSVFIGDFMLNLPPFGILKRFTESFVESVR